MRQHDRLRRLEAAKPSLDAIAAMTDAELAEAFLDVAERLQAEDIDEATRRHCTRVLALPWGKPDAAWTERQMTELMRLAHEATGA